MPELGRHCYDLDSSSDSDSEDHDHDMKKNTKSNKNEDGSSDSDSSAVLEIESPIQKKRKFSSKKKIEKETTTTLKKNKPGIDNSKNNIKISASDVTSTITTTSNSNNLKKRPPSAAPSASTGVARASTTQKRVMSLKKFELSSDSDSSDDEILYAKPVFFDTKDQIKQRKKREREEQKQQEKVANARKRQQEKEERERQKELQKATKKKETEEYNQSNGKYKRSEIAILLDPQLYQGDPLELVQKLSPDFLVKSYPSTLSSSPTAIQFIRKDYLQGGAEDAVKSLESNKTEGYEHLHHVVIVVEAEDFVGLLKRQEKEEDDNYPALEAWLESIKSDWQNVWSHATTIEPKLLLLLRDLPEKLNRMWVDHRRRHRNEPSLPTDWELQDAIQWLLVQFQVECMFCPNDELIQVTMHKMARSLSDKPYTNEIAEIECVQKIKGGPILSEDLVDKARDVWVRQLQQVPRLSEDMANNVIQHYPTCQSLWQAYQQLVREGRAGEAASLLAGIMSQNRNYNKVSEAVFRVMTSNDPKQMII
jgi:hypothetical protein